jgi:hypothetical protein
MPRARFSSRVYRRSRSRPRHSNRDFAMRKPRSCASRNGQTPVRPSSASTVPKRNTIETWDECNRVVVGETRRWACHWPPTALNRCRRPPSQVTEPRRHQPRSPPPCEALRQEPGTLRTPSSRPELTAELLHRFHASAPAVVPFGQTRAPELSYFPWAALGKGERFRE